jgi:hypothetical protein
VRSAQRARSAQPRHAAAQDNDALHRNKTRTPPSNYVFFVIRPPAAVWWVLVVDTSQSSTDAQ